VCSSDLPIHVVPHLSQFGRLAAAGADDRAALHARLKGAGDGRYVFYTIGFWSHRKAPYLAVQAYWRAFTADDPVLLAVKTCDKDLTRWRRSWRNGFCLRHPSPRDTVAGMARQYARPAPVAVIADESLGDGELLALHEMGDCFVSLTRAEGWGLGAFEAARLGKPVIMTGYGGQTDFLPPEHAWLVDYAMTPVHEPTWPGSYKAGDEWAEPSIETAARFMREVYTQQAAATARAAGLKARIAEAFSEAAVIAAFEKALA
jgi:glycosyltransferase involved in cell wall biosynthesis